MALLYQSPVRSFETVNENCHKVPGIGEENKKATTIRIRIENCLVFGGTGCRARHRGGWSRIYTLPFSICQFVSLSPSPSYLIFSVCCLSFALAALLFCPSFHTGSSLHTSPVHVCRNVERVWDCPMNVEACNTRVQATGVHAHTQSQAREWCTTPNEVASLCRYYEDRLIS